jgi:hypothetical protein
LDAFIKEKSSSTVITSLLIQYLTCMAISC